MATEVVVVVVVVEVVVVVVRTGCMTTMFIHQSQRMHRISGRTPESQTPGVTATWATTSRRTEAEKCCISAAKYPSDALDRDVDERI